MSEIRPKVLVLAAVVLASSLIGPVAWGQFRRLWYAVPALYRAVTTSAFEQRRLQVYGDCDRMGYGYVRRMLDGFPDRDAVPSIRYPEWGPHAELVLPTMRARRDDRVLIGIGLAGNDMREGRVAGATLQTLEHQDDGSVTGTWLFQTLVDVDQMTGLALAFASYPVAHPMVITLILQYAIFDVTALGEWEITVPAGQPDDLVVHSPSVLRRFSIGPRAWAGFVVETRVRGASSKDASSLIGIGILGVKVDTAGHVVVNREQGCFTAIRRDFFDEIQRMPGHRWSHYVERIRNVRVE